jgi:peptidoglycan/xylan/chitin deacetylase (PgdA/CDA1 family)
MEASNNAAATGRLRAAAKALMPRALVVRRLRAGARSSVLLTLDDGPDPDVTPAVLDRLDAYGAKAAFFVVGRRLKRAGDLLARIHRAGHVVGNHSHLHRDRYVLSDGPHATIAEYYRDCARCQLAIEERLGARPRWFRPPGGRLTVTTLLVPRLLGLRCITWSQDVEDWRFRELTDARAGADALVRAIRPGDIVLLHDNNPRVLDLLDVLLPALQARGFDLGDGVHLM